MPTNVRLKSSKQIRRPHGTFAFKIMEGFMGHFKTYNPKTFAKNGQNKTATKPQRKCRYLGETFLECL